MNKVKLEALNVIVADPYLDDNDVHVNFEYDKLSEKELKLVLEAHIGRNQDCYRFFMKVIYHIEFQYYYYDDNDLIENAIHIAIEPFMDLVVMIDQLVQEPKERLS